MDPRLIVNTLAPLVLGLAYTFLFLALHPPPCAVKSLARKLRNLQIARSGEA
jgi:hypothetical protein